MSKPTPGPWVLDLDTFEDGYAYLETPTGRAVALVDEAIRADLNLIAAAPCLLEALREIIEWDDRYPVPGNPTGGIARAAIKKATGEE